MDSVAEIKPYRWLAQYYDEVFSAFRGPMVAGRERLLRGILPRVGTACDLACGTGITAVGLAQRGIRMYGVDLSAGMCRAAREKARRAGVPLRVIHADMRDFRLPEAVDLITCEYDAVNHVPRPRDLRRVVRCVARALRPGGHFYFDVNHSRGFERYWTGVLWIERPGMVLAMRNGHNGRADRAWCDLEWFIREGRSWHRRRERVEEVCWPDQAIQNVLRHAGFDTIRRWDGAQFFKGNPLIDRGCRSVYLARKAAS